jgi:ATP-dependent Clp protease ATP-binding subunit ClpA
MHQAISAFDEQMKQVAEKRFQHGGENSQSTRRRFQEGGSSSSGLLRLQDNPEASHEPKGMRGKYARSSAASSSTKPHEPEVTAEPKVKKPKKTIEKPDNPDQKKKHSQKSEKKEVSQKPVHATVKVTHDTVEEWTKLPLGFIKDQFDMRKLVMTKALLKEVAKENKEGTGKEKLKAELITRIMKFDKRK